MNPITIVFAGIKDHLHIRRLLSSRIDAFELGPPMIVKIHAYLVR